MSRSNREIVHEGWLIKSPPTKRIWRARWRRRWFTLRHSGELPGQFFLEYYTDRNCRKLKGTIDLDQCEQVDAGLHFEQRKLKYPYMFDVKTPSRTYYLAAESEQDMNSWVECICQVCGLKAYVSDDQELNIPVPEPHELVDLIQPENKFDACVPETPPISPVSGPYIPISECISGRPKTIPEQDLVSLLHRNATNSALNSTDTVFVPPTPQKKKQQSTEAAETSTENDPRFYDLPRQLQPCSSETKASLKWQESLNSSVDRTSTPPLQSPTDSESVFTDDEWSHPVLPIENGIKEPRPSDSSVDIEPSSWSVVQRFGKLQVVDSCVKTFETTLDEAPPRPPKPSHLGKGPSYLNLGNSPRETRVKANAKESVELTQTGNSAIASSAESDSKQAISDEMYDFPRSHNVGESESSRQQLTARHCYNNAVPVTLEGQVFRYDVQATEAVTNEASVQYDGAHDEEPASPCSQSSSSTMAMYSNLPSPLLPDGQSGTGPPIVNRCLKPGRKLSDSMSICSLPEPSSPRAAPNVDRKLKPQPPARKTSEFELDNFTIGRPQRAAPSPTPPVFSARDDDLGDNEQIYFYQYKNNFTAAPRGSEDFDKLQYLDLDLESDVYRININPTQPLKSPVALTVYKTVDFAKTEAFNNTRQCVEKSRKLHSDS